MRNRHFSFGNTPFGQFVDEIGTTHNILGQSLIKVASKAGLTIHPDQVRQIKKLMDDMVTSWMNSKNHFATVTLSVSYVIPGERYALGMRKHPDTTAWSEVYIELLESEEQGTEGKPLRVCRFLCKPDISDKLIKAGVPVGKFVTVGGWPGDNAEVAFNLEAYKKEYLPKPPAPPAPAASRWRLWLALMLVGAAVVGLFTSKLFIVAGAASLLITIFLGKRWWIGLTAGSVITIALYFIT